MEIVIASANRNKIAELQLIAKDFAVTLLSPEEAQKRIGLGPLPEVDEPEMTYYGNALRKAEAFAQWSGLPALGDDSGLEVDLLDGRPGVHSARYGGGVADRERCRLLLEEVAKTKSTPSQIVRAQFCCCLVLAQASQEPLSVEVTLPGTLLEEFRGEHGFGYDPVVHIDALGCTLAEIDFARLCRDGFRAKAVRELFELCLIPSR
jgi:XTP/dITP diphosphohydrolase